MNGVVPDRIEHPLGADAILRVHSDRRKNAQTTVIVTDSKVGASRLRTDRAGTVPLERRTWNAFPNRSPRRVRAVQIALRRGTLTRWLINALNCRSDPTPSERPDCFGLHCDLVASPDY